jgi:hypothetical protein
MGDDDGQLIRRAGDTQHGGMHAESPVPQP